MIKNQVKILARISIFILATSLASHALAATESEEISIPDELKKTVTHKEISPDDSSVFDDCRIHGGASFMNTFQDYAIAPGVRERGGLRGFELNFGIDMFSPHLIAEGVLGYYPEAQIDDTRLSSNDFELRLLFDTSTIESITVHAGAGIASRTYDIKTQARADGSVTNGDRSFSSGATALIAGVDYWPSTEVSLGLEVSDHIPLANGDDPSSIDLGVKLNGHF